jgi:hypothetical protein
MYCVLKRNSFESLRSLSTTINHSIFSQNTPPLALSPFATGRLLSRHHIPNFETKQNVISNIRRPPNSAILIPILRLEMKSIHEKVSADMQQNKPLAFCSEAIHD